MQSDSGKVLGQITLQFSNRFRHLQYSLSPELDSQRNAKLCKFIVTVQSRYVPEYNITIDAFERCTEIRKVESPHPDTVRAYIQRYKRQFIK